MSREITLRLRGEGVSGGSCMARVLTLRQKKLHIPTEPAEDPQKELERYREAHQEAVRQLTGLHEVAAEKLGERDAGIFEAHLSLLEDRYSISEPIEALILQEGYNAVHAAATQFDRVAELFGSLGDALMAERAADAKDIKERLLRILLKQEQPDLSTLREDTILVARELTPSDTVQIDLKHVVGIVTYHGGQTAHTAIIARTLGIPAIAHVRGLHRIRSGATAILDGGAGTLIVEPEEADIEVFRHRQTLAAQREAELRPFIHRESVTADGVRLELAANIGSSEEASEAVKYGADGVGLFRSEFLYMDRGTIPGENEQTARYSEALRTMAGKPVIIRTLDVGGDKKLPALKLPREENPFLGCRAVRLCLQRPELFKTQLRALLRSACAGQLKIMFPMISGITELRRARALLDEAREELKSEGTPYGPVKLGIMVEIPSAAVMADRLAEEVDFFSIGTNDLIQYSLAAERGNQAVAELYTPFHPGVLRLIAMTAKAARDHGIVCGMCGEAAGDPRLIPVWLGLGLRELSMSPRLIPGARQLISTLRLEDAEKTAQAALNCGAAEAVLAMLEH